MSAPVTHTTTAGIRIPTRNLVSAALAACLSLAGAALVGCENDTETADRVVDGNIREARAAYDIVEKGKRREGDSEVFTKLKQALSQANASAAAKANAARLLAQADMDAGLAVARDVARKEADIALLVTEINHLASDVDANNLAIAGLKEFDKTATGAVQKDKEQQTLIQSGAAGGAWVAAKGKGAALPAMATVDKRIDELQKAIAAEGKKQAALKAQQLQFNRESDRAIRESERAQGKESVALFKKGADLRRQASRAVIDSEAIDTKLLPLKRELALAQEQKKHLTAALAVFKGREEKNAARRKELADLIAAQQALSAEAVSATGGGDDAGEGGAGETPPPAPPPADEPADEAEPAADRGNAEQDGEAVLAAAEDDPEGSSAGTRGGRAAPAAAAPAVALEQGRSIAEKSDILLALVKDAWAQRNQAEQHFNDAIAHYKEAMGYADKVMQEVTPKLNNGEFARQPQREAWVSLSETFAPGQYHLAIADAHLALAALYRDQAASLAARGRMLNTLRPVLKAADNTALPKALSDMAALPPPTGPAAAPAETDDGGSGDEDTQGTEGASGAAGAEGATAAGGEGDLVAQAAAVWGKANQAYEAAEGHLLDAIKAPDTTESARAASRKAYVRYVAARFAHGAALVEAGQVEKGDDLIKEAKDAAGMIEPENVRDLSRRDYPESLLRALELAGESAGLDAAGAETPATGPTTNEAGEGGSGAFSETGEDAGTGN